MLMCKMLLSINPEHVENILSGYKTFEFRKKKCKSNVDWIVIYSTSPVKRVVGEVQILEVIEDSPGRVWAIASKSAGISKNYFDKYYENKDKAVAYKLGKVKKYKKPLELIDLGINFAPQSFIYLA